VYINHFGVRRCYIAARPEIYAADYIVEYEGYQSNFCAENTQFTKSFLCVLPLEIKNNLPPPCVQISRIGAALLRFRTFCIFPPALPSIIHEM
jgi:hypothetical protein